MDGSFEGEGRRYALYVIVALVVVGFGAAAWASVQRARDDEGVLRPPSEAATGAGIAPDETEGPTAVATTEPAVPPASPSASESMAPSPSASPTVAAGEEGTVLFGGGPARGPWQQLGTVAEITHPGAPTSARYSYANFWSDPAEENQPDALWDRIVIEVTDQLVQLGDPVDRPVFGGAEGSEPFNSFGGMNDFYPDDGVFTATWRAAFEDTEGLAFVFFPYLIEFSEGTVLATAQPQILRDDGSRTVEDNTRESLSWVQQWASAMGYDGCARCS